MSYEPFPLLDFKGIHIEKEPWLSPPKAWQVLENANVYRGRLTKREGYRHQQSLGIPVSGESVGVLGSAFYARALTHRKWVMPKDPFTTYDPTHYTLKFTANWASGTMTLYVGQVEVLGGGTITRTVYDEATGLSAGTIAWNQMGTGWSGYYTITFPHTTTSNPVVAYEYAQQNPVMGFATHITPLGNEYNLCFTTTRAYLLNQAEERYYNLEPSLLDIWSGTVNDHFWCESYGNILVINNGVDPPYKYDPGATPYLQVMGTNFDGAPGNDIQAAHMFVDYLGYGVYLGTKEAGTWHGGRARWTQNGNAEAFNSANDFIDAPENDLMVSAGMVAGDLLVGFRDSGWWKFEVTNDAFAPFRWIPLRSDRGAVAQNGTNEFAESLVTRDRYGLMEVSRRGQAEASLDLGDKPLEWSPDYAYLTQAIRYRARRQAWWSYADAGDTTPMHVLCMQMELDGERSLSLYDVALHAFGSYRTTNDRTWDSTFDTWDSLDGTWDDPTQRGGFPILVGGDVLGEIYVFDGSLADWREVSQDTVLYPHMVNTAYAATPIVARAKSIRINPYPGKRVRLGWIDIVLEPKLDNSITLRIYADYEAAAYKALVISADPAGAGGAKVIKRIPVNRIATFHTIELEEATTAGMAIDYIAPYMKPVAGPREID